MGGLGSGGHNHLGRVPVERCRALDATELKRKGLLADGVRGWMTWSGADGNENKVEIVGGRDAVVLRYAWQRDADWVPVREEILLRRSMRYKGGEEAYFGCPQCGAQVKRLHLMGHLFRCRSCHRLVHAASGEGTGDRATRKVQKLRRRMNSPEAIGEIIRRPKGMHRATYDRRVEVIYAAEQEVWDGTLRLLARLRRSETSINRPPTGQHFWA